MDRIDNLRYNNVRAVDPFEIFDAYKRVMTRHYAWKRDHASIVAARLLGKNRCKGCKVFLDKPDTYCDDCIPF